MSRTCLMVAAISATLFSKSGRKYSSGRTLDPILSALVGQLNARLDPPKQIRRDRDVTFSRETVAQIALTR